MFKKKLILLATLLAFSSLLLMPLSAQAGCCQKKSCDKTAAMDKGCMMKETLKLTPEQAVKLEKMHNDMQKVMVEQKSVMQKAHLEMKELMKKNEVKALDAKIDEISKLQAEMQKKHMAHRMAVRGLLNEEQKVKFDEMACGMMAGHGSHQACCKTAGQGCNQACCKTEKKAESTKKSVACGDDCSKCDITKKSKK